MSHPDDSPDAQLSFEEALAELERVVHDLEEGRIGLSESLARYEQGIRLLRHCHGLLDTAGRRIELLLGADAEGNPITAPFDAAPTQPEAHTPAARSRRRSLPVAPESESPCGPEENPPGSLF